ncbi:MAG: DUF4386 domain-containing protein [Anaerolineaceae bacterium]|nr:DUF4386 domain-containing protein [Anaerolineaceae bacterium]
MTTKENMISEKKSARATGILFIVTTAAAIVSGSFLLPILDSPDYLANISANENQAMLGVLFYFIMAAGGACITIPMYPILKRQNKSLALGAVGFRFVEGAIFMVGVMCVLSLVTLSKEFVQAGAPDASYFQTTGALLLSGYTINNALMPGLFAFSIGALMYYSIFYKSKLIPRWLSIWGLVGIVLGMANTLLRMFGINPDETISLLSDLPIFAQEMVMAVWLFVKGFNPDVISKMKP